MISLDTNVLVPALDEQAPGHQPAFAVYRRLFEEPDRWIVADQTLFELYWTLRNPKVFANPLDGEQALSVIEEIRERSQAQCAAYETSHWAELTRLLGTVGRRKGILVFDAVLAVTLRAHGVERFFTRNVEDFEAFGLFEVVDPIVG